MSTHVLCKVYGHLWPAPPALEAALRPLVDAGLPAEQDVPPLERDGDMLRLSFEGVYFPFDDVVAVVAAHLTPQLQGKLDLLDLEAWALTRCTPDHGTLRRHTVPLNHVLDYAGH